MDSPDVSLAALKSSYVSRVRVRCWLVAIRIMLVDDHDRVRENIRHALELTSGWQVCCEAGDGLEAIEKFLESRPDVTILDFLMPRMNGLDAARAILAENPSSPILMLTVLESRQLVQEAKKLGIRGFCWKTELPLMKNAVEALLRGETYFPN
jgi:DNA-binding NarL/FixJ family response regulator